LKRQIPLFLLLLGSAYPGFSQQCSNSPALPVDSFFSDSGLGFDGHYNRCVWVCCTKGLRPGDTIQNFKLCGGMIGACPKSPIGTKTDGTSNTAGTISGAEAAGSLCSSEKRDLTSD